MVPAQLTAFLEVLPAWLPPVAIGGGFVLLAVGVGREYVRGVFGDWSTYSPVFAAVSVGCLGVSTAGAVYVTVRTADLVLLFVFFTFVAGRVIQGAIAAKIVQKLLDFLVFDSGSGDGRYLRRAVAYVVSKLEDRLVIGVATGVITTVTALSILGVYLVGSGETIEAVRRFWIGFFFLTVATLVFDFRYFAHRISWLPAFGLVLATAGAFLYSPAGFSSFTSVLAPYLENPLPDWTRLPLGVAGFVLGVVLWAVFYLDRPTRTDR